MDHQITFRPHSIYVSVNILGSGPPYKLHKQLLSSEDCGRAWIRSKKKFKKEAFRTDGHGLRKIP